MKHLLFKLKNNSKGSGIVTVLVAVLFLTAFGTLSLYLTYTSTEMVASERRGNEAAYNAYTCMEEIKAGLQITVSDAISATYKEVMPDYVKHNTDVSNQFNSLYMQKIMEAKVINYNQTALSDGAMVYDDLRLFNPGTGVDDNGNPKYTDGTYNGAAIANLVAEERAGSCVVYSGNPNNANGTLKVSDKEITLENITISYVDGTGRKSSVTSDLCIGVPDIGYLLTQYSISGIPDFTLICKGALKQTNDAGNRTVRINGSTYAGSVELTNANQMVIGGGSSFIVKNDITVNGTVTGTDVLTQKEKCRLLLNAGTTLWARNILLGESSSMMLNGASYIANDLNYTGKNARGYLSGTYYGFGCDANDPDQSSSIIFNKATGSSSRNKLYMEGLTDLTLAGVSFISNTGRYLFVDGAQQYTGTSTGTGMSIGTKFNQIVYFAPRGSVTPYYIKTVGNYIVMKLDTNVPSPKQYYALKNGSSYTFYEYKERLEEVTDGEGNVSYVATGEYQMEPTTDSVTYNPEVEEGEFTTDTDGITFYENETELEKVAFFALDGETYTYDSASDTFKLTAKSTESFPADSDMSGKKYSDYGISLQPINETLSDGTIEVTFFLKFDTQAHSNQYFYDYYNASDANAEKINSYLETYVSLSGQDNPTYRTSGNTFSSNGIIQALAENFEALRTEAQFLKEIYDNYCVTLSNKPFSTTATNPFDCYINADKISAEVEEGHVLYFYNSAGKTVGVVVNGNYNYDGSINTLCIIIATGNVEVSATYDGIIFAGGNVEVESNIYLRRYAEGVADAYNADTINEEHSHNSTASIGGTPDRLLKDYFNMDISQEYLYSNSGAGDAWDVEQLVTYKNWHR